MNLFKMIELEDEHRLVIQASPESDTIELIRIIPSILDKDGFTVAGAVGIPKAKIDILVEVLIDYIEERDMCLAVDPYNPAEKLDSIGEFIAKKELGGEENGSK